MSDPNREPGPLVSHAWRLIGLTRSEPGVLALVGDRLTYSSDAGEVFSAPIERVSDIRFPWYWFGGGIKLTIGAIRLRLSFVRPNGADTAMDRVASGAGDPAAMLNVVQNTVRVVHSGRAAGKRWRDRLADRTG